jgi:transcription elongation factor Elf1
MKKKLICKRCGSNKIVSLKEFTGVDFDSSDELICAYCGGDYELWEIEEDE